MNTLYFECLKHIPGKKLGYVKGYSKAEVASRYPSNYKISGPGKDRETYMVIANCHTIIIFRDESGKRFSLDVTDYLKHLYNNRKFTKSFINKINIYLKDSQFKVIDDYACEGLYEKLNKMSQIIK